MNIKTGRYITHGTAFVSYIAFMSLDARGTWLGGLNNCIVGMLAYAVTAVLTATVLTFL